MRRFAVVVVALVGLMALPGGAPMDEMKGMAVAMSSAGITIAETQCSSVACSPMPMSATCLTLCVAVVALVGAIAVARRAAGSTRVGVSPTAFVDRIVLSSVFRPPRPV